MGERKRAPRALEHVKTLVIILLAVSAVYLTLRSQVFSSAFTTPPAQGNQNLPGFDNIPAAPDSAAAIARPVRIAVRSESGRYAVQYDPAGIDGLFAQTGSLLSETLSSVGHPQSVSRGEWETALAASPGVFFDFLGSLPLRTLQGWLASGPLNEALSGSARRLVITAGAEETVMLYYHNEENGMYYACQTDVVRQGQLLTAIGGVTPNGARFLFETEELTGLHRDMLLLNEPPRMALYSAASPLGPGQENARSAVAEALTFSSQSSSTYEAEGGETVVRSGADTLRIDPDGTVTFTSGMSGEPRFPVPAGPDGEMRREDMLQTAYGVAAAALLPYLGEGQLYLRSVEEQPDGSTEICFDYCLWGAEVQLEGGAHAAQIVMSDGQITGMSLTLRTYTATGETAPALPEGQAQAAALALGGENLGAGTQMGLELRMCYQDSVTQTMTAKWIAQAF